MKSKHLPFLGIGLFIVTLLLKNSYNTGAMIIMLFCMMSPPFLSACCAARKEGKNLFCLLWREIAYCWQPFFYVLFACYLINVVGLLYTDNLYQGVKQLDTTLPFLLFPLAFCITPFSQRNIELLLRFFIWTVILFCIFGLLSYFVIVAEINADMFYRNSRLYAKWLMLWPAHWHPSFNCTIVLMALPASFWLCCHRRPVLARKRWMILVETILGVLLPVIFTLLSGARVGMVIIPLLLGLAYVCYCRFKPVLKWGLVAAGLIAVIFLSHHFLPTNNRFKDAPREYMRAIAVEAIMEKPLLGWGTGSVLQLLQSPERAQRVGLDAPYSYNQFHNQYLEEVVQFGIPGALLLLLLTGWLLYLGIRRKDYLLLSFLTIYLLFFWTETVLATAKGIIPFTFWVCFLIVTQKTRSLSVKGTIDTTNETFDSTEVK